MPRKKKRKVRIDRILLLVGLATVVAGAATGGIYGLSSLLRMKIQGSNVADAQTQTGADQNNTSGTNQTADKKKTGKKASFTFNGVGDLLFHDPIFIYFEQDNGTRDFDPLFELTKSYTSSADLNYANMETICAGDEYELTGYPMFNGPLEMIDTFSRQGWDVLSTSSNHSYDRQSDGIITEMNYIDQNHPEMKYIGSHLSEEAANTPHVLEINGLKVGLAGFTYGLNGFILPDDQKWLIDVFLKEDGSVNYGLMQKRLDALKAASDVQIVFMHWGDEYHTEPNDIQKEVTNYLHSQGVEAIIGTHPHVIEPCELIVDDDQQTLVYYSLGNFISAQDSSETMVGGMADFTMNYDFDTEKATFENVKFIPTVTWISPDLRQYRTTTIREYNDDMAANHFVLTQMGQDISPQWVKDYVASVIGQPEGIEVVYE